MAIKGAGKRHFGWLMLAVACLALTGAAAWPLFGRQSNSLANIAHAGDTTATLGKAERQSGPTGLPLPRFVSLKAEKVNVRRGPSSEHPVSWVFKRKGLPVEIVAEFENWRRIRDSDGEEGWILQNMLSGKRTAMVAPWRNGQTMPLLADAAGGSVIAKISAGVVSDVESCTGEWCLVTAGGYEGWIEQAMLWGVYPGESVD